MPDPHPHASTAADPDPRRAAAQRLLAKAHAELEAKESGSRRPLPAPGRGAPRTQSPAARLFSLPEVDASVWLHAIMLALALTGALLALVVCFHLLNLVFVAGRIIAIPTGLVAAFALSYASACYLGVLETASHGRASVDDGLSGGWQEWFWTLPMTIGMVAAAAFMGWLASRVAPGAAWQILWVVMGLSYPVLQLSALENGSLSPLSLPILKTLATRPLIWAFAFAATFALWGGVGVVVRMTWRDPPYATAAVLGPVVAVALFAYAMALGLVARGLARAEAGNR